MGGVDLSKYFLVNRMVQLGPRPCGRGGFKQVDLLAFVNLVGPRPCGRGGFKHTLLVIPIDIDWSPPVWAGWI